MRRSAVLTATLVGGLVGAAVLAPTPAAADHVVDVDADGCSWGPFINPLGYPLSTTTVRLQRDEQGRVSGFTCHFTGIPAYLTAEETVSSDPWDITRYDRYSGVRTVDCQVPEATETRVVEGRARITRAGTAILRCEIPEELRAAPGR